MKRVPPPPRAPPPALGVTNPVARPRTSTPSAAATSILINVATAWPQPVQKPASHCHPKGHKQIWPARSRPQPQQPPLGRERKGQAKDTREALPPPPCLHSQWPLPPTATGNLQQGPTTRAPDLAARHPIRLPGPHTGRPGQLRRRRQGSGGGDKRRRIGAPPPSPCACPGTGWSHRSRDSHPAELHIARTGGGTDGRYRVRHRKAIEGGPAAAIPVSQKALPVANSGGGAAREGERRVAARVLGGAAHVARVGTTWGLRLEISNCVFLF